MDTLELPYYRAPLTKRTVSHHRTVAIVESEKRGEFLVEIYDPNNTTNYDRGRVGLIGGNHTSEDISPKDILERTLQESFLEGFGKVVLNVVNPYKDFYFEMPAQGSRTGEKYIYSVFRVQFPQDNFEQARSSICCDGVIKKEGSLRICSIVNLLSGNPLTACGTGLIIGEYTGIALPNADKGLLQAIGTPRKYLEQYLTDFEYQRPVRISTG